MAAHMSRAAWAFAARSDAIVQKSRVLVTTFNLLVKAQPKIQKTSAWLTLRIPNLFNVSSQRNNQSNQVNLLCQTKQSTICCTCIILLIFGRVILFIR